VTVAVWSIFAPIAETEPKLSGPADTTKQVAVIVMLTLSVPVAVAAHAAEGAAIANATKAALPARIIPVSPCPQNPFRVRRKIPNESYQDVNFIDQIIRKLREIRMISLWLPNRM
jgi:hypothetical protein